MSGTALAAGVFPDHACKTPVASSLRLIEHIVTLYLVRYEMNSGDPLPTRTLKDIGISESAHPTWIGAITPETRSDQLHEDHSAWYGVTGLLLFIISVGVSLAVFTVVVCLSN